jgi:hypothetical protein
MVPNVFIIRKKTHAVLAIKARGGNRASKGGRAKKNKGEKRN